MEYNLETLMNGTEERVISQNAAYADFFRECKEYILKTADYVLEKAVYAGTFKL